MTTRPPSSEELNAYVDGELPTPDAARVARALADCPDLAERVAVLSRLKATVQASQGETPPVTLGGTPRRQVRSAVAAAAACLAVAFGYLAFLSVGGQHEGAGLADYAWTVHDDWVEAAEPGSASGAPPLVEASLSDLGGGVYVPDLSDARLTVGHLSLIDGRYGEGLHVGYRGTRGCRLSLLILPWKGGEALDTPKAPGPERRIQAWQSGGFAYLLLASGMDPRHFSTVAATAREAIRHHQPLAETERMALRDSRARSRPCLA